MTTIYIIRHGESTSNVKKTFTGHLNYALSPLGEKQAEKVTQYFKNIKVDCVYSSDLIRAYNTVKGVADAKGLKIKTSKNFREIFGGDWEGKKFDYLYENCPDYHIWKENMAKTVCPNGESVEDVYNRANAELDKVAKENEGKTIIIGTHATPVRVIMTRILYENVDSLTKVQWVPNCSVTQIFYNDGKYSLGIVGDVSHLGNDITVLPKTV